jgi:hypothetical protein
VVSDGNRLSFDCQTSFGERTARGRDIFRLLRVSTLTGTFSLVPTIIVPIGTTPFHLRRREVARVYRCHWKIHAIQMTIVIGFGVWIEMRLNKRVVVRVQA